MLAFALGRAMAVGLSKPSNAQQVPAWCAKLPYHHVRARMRIDLGDRTLEVLRVPGHAPDAIALLDRSHGLLFTGDTFYAGPIYVFGKGADAAAFTRSTGRLAALAPQLRKVLASHNVPVSKPEMLVECATSRERCHEGR